MATSWLDTRLVTAASLVALLAWATTLATGCEEALGGPSITSFTISPDEIPRTDTGMTDEHFTMALTVSGFEAEIDDVNAFIQENGHSHPREDASYDLSIQGNSIDIEGVPLTWFSGVGAGTYNIGATVTDVNESEVTQRNLAEVTVTE